MKKYEDDARRLVCEGEGEEVDRTYGSTFDNFDYNSWSVREDSTYTT